MIKFKTQKIQNPIKVENEDLSSIKFLGKKKIRFEIEKEPDTIKDNKIPQKFIFINYLKGHWSSEENKRFIEAIVKYGTNWEKVHNEVKTRSQIQIRSHAQKFYLRLKKCKNEELGINFTSNTIRSIKDMIKHIQSVNSDYDIVKIFLNLPKLCEIQNKTESDIEKICNIDLYENLFKDKDDKNDLINRFINGPFLTHNINNNYNLILYSYYINSVNNYLNFLIVNHLNIAKINNNGINLLLNNYLQNLNNYQINNLQNNSLNNKILINSLNNNNSNLNSNIES